MILQNIHVQAIFSFKNKMFFLIANKMFFFLLSYQQNAYHYMYEVYLKKADWKFIRKKPIRSCDQID